MAQKKPSKIIFCRYRHPLVEEVGEFYSNHLRVAKETVKLRNDLIAPDNLDDEFWFLNARIAGETHIITAAGQRDYPSNDPQIVAKLEAYLAGQLPINAGHAQKRSLNKTNYLPEHESVVWRVASPQAAAMLVAKLQERMGERALVWATHDDNQDSVIISTKEHTKPEILRLIKELEE